MELNKELEKLKSYMDEGIDNEFKKQSDFIHANFTSETEQKTIDNFISGILSELSSQTKELIHQAESILVKEQLKEVSEIISLSYIAKKYFNKNRSWLHQKINGNLKNGKPVKFTASEIETFNYALRDISKRIGSTAIQ
jgi:predicted ester cyclase